MMRYSFKTFKFKLLNFRLRFQIFQIFGSKKFEIFKEIQLKLFMQTF